MSAPDEALVAILLKIDALCRDHDVQLTPDALHLTLRRVRTDGKRLELTQDELPMAPSRRRRLEGVLWGETA